MAECGHGVPFGSPCYPCRVQYARELATVARDFNLEQIDGGDVVITTRQASAIPTEAKPGHPLWPVDDGMPSEEELLFMSGSGPIDKPPAPNQPPEELMGGKSP